jgi:RNA polymerase sigma-70 factor (ECF subfamily)
VSSTPLRSDSDLVEEAQTGDRDAYAELVGRYHSAALGTAFLILGEQQDAEDAVQEAFTRAFLALHRYRPNGSFRAWLLTIVANQARTQRTAMLRRSDVLTRASGQVPALHPAPSAEIAALAHDRRDAILRALLRLPERDRLVITYRYFFDLSEEETADILGVARGTIKSRMARALARLRPILAELGPLAIAGPGMAWLSGSALSGAGSGSGSSTRGQPSVQAALAGVAATAAGMVVLGAALLVAPDTARMERAPSSSPADVATPLPEANPPAAATTPRTAIVYGADLTESERQELALAFGDPEGAAIESVPREELIATLATHGLSVSEDDEALSSAAIACQPAGTGLHVRTVGIEGVPASAYADALRVVGLRDAQVTIAAPIGRGVSGETALVGALKAAPLCVGAPLEPDTVATAYQHLQAAITNR